MLPGGDPLPATRERTGRVLHQMAEIFLQQELRTGTVLCGTVEILLQQEKWTGRVLYQMVEILLLEIESGLGESCTNGGDLVATRETD